MERLASLYETFNRRVFDGVLLKVTIDHALNRTAILHFSPPDKLLIGAGMGPAKPQQVIDELIHCMVHIRNHQAKIEDVTKNQYHKQEFKAFALSVGLIVGWCKNRGWAVTFCRNEEAQAWRRKTGSSANCHWPDKLPHDRLLKVIDDVCLTKDDLADVQRKIMADVAAKKQSKQFLLRYICKCPAPYNMIRSGRRPHGNHPLNITCNLCGAKFKHADEPQKKPKKSQSSL